MVFLFVYCISFYHSFGISTTLKSYLSSTCPSYSIYISIPCTASVCLLFVIIFNGFSWGFDTKLYIHLYIVCIFFYIWSSYFLLYLFTFLACCINILLCCGSICWKTLILYNAATLGEHQNNSSPTAHHFLITAAYVHLLVKRTFVKFRTTFLEKLCIIVWYGSKIKKRTFEPHLRLA